MRTLTFRVTEISRARYAFLKFFNKEGMLPFTGCEPKYDATILSRAWNTAIKGCTMIG